ncbi:unnamed protein product, partial [Mesorhabditis spiculigera]
MIVTWVATKDLAERAKSAVRNKIGNRKEERPDSSHTTPTFPLASFAPGPMEKVMLTASKSAAISSSTKYPSSKKF